MSVQKQKKPEQPPQQVKLTVRIDPKTYVAITDLQRAELLRTGKRKPLQEIVEAAILSYAKEEKVEPAP